MADMQQTVPQVSGQWAGVAYVPCILRTMAEICEAMGVGQKTVKKWVAQGAPIAVEGDGRRKRYSAEMAALQGWRSHHGDILCTPLQLTLYNYHLP